MAAPGGDYLTLQRENSAIIVDIALPGTALAATVYAPGRPNHTIFVQLVVVTHVTHVAGKVVTVGDDTGTPALVSTHTDQAAGAGVPDTSRQDFGPHGIPLTEGQGLTVLANTGGSGFVGRVHIEAYRRITSTINLTTANTAS